MFWYLFLAQSVILGSLLKGGPCHPVDKIINSRISGDSAVFTIRTIFDLRAFAESGGETPQEGNYVDRRVELVKEGKFWKVRGFGGGRSRLVVTDF